MQSTNQSSALLSTAVASVIADTFDLGDFEDISSGNYVVKHPETGRPTALVITLAGPEHPLRKKKQYARIRKLRAETAKAGKLQLDDPADEDEIANRDIADCILGWTGLVINGQEVPWSFEEAFKLMRDTKRRWLRDQLKAALDERELFIKSGAGK